MELLTKDGWNPVNDIESVIVSVRSLLVVGDGRLEAAHNLSEQKYSALLAESEAKRNAESAYQGDGENNEDPALKRQRKNSEGESGATNKDNVGEIQRRFVRDQGGSYSASEAQAAYSHLSDYHKKKGWDTSGWWARKG
jgi:ubiquitin-conjugating enzyme E2 Q